MLRQILLLCAGLALLAQVLGQYVPGTVELVSYKLPTRQRCGQGVWLAMKVIPRLMGTADELYCGFENPDWERAGFTIQERVTRFKHFNPAKYHLEMGAGLDRVFWEFSKQGEPFFKDKEFLFKTKVALNKTNVATSSYTWELVCEFKWLDGNGDEVYEVVPIEKTTTVAVSRCK